MPKLLDQKVRQHAGSISTNHSSAPGTVSAVPVSGDANVQNIQKYLNNAGFKVGVDGVYGKETHDAVIALTQAYQSKLNSLDDSSQEALHILSQLAKLPLATAAKDTQLLTNVGFELSKHMAESTVLKPRAPLDTAYVKVDVNGKERLIPITLILHPEWGGPKMFEQILYRYGLVDRDAPVKTKIQEIYSAVNLIEDSIRDEDKRLHLEPGTEDNLLSAMMHQMQQVIASWESATQTAPGAPVPAQSQQSVLARLVNQFPILNRVSDDIKTKVIGNVYYMPGGSKLISGPQLNAVITDLNSYENYEATINQRVAAFLNKLNIS